VQLTLVSAREITEQTERTEQTEALKPFSSPFPSVPLFPFFPYSLDRSACQHPIAQVDKFSSALYGLSHHWGSRTKTFIAPYRLV
jgi:hypothetical protein